MKNPTQERNNMLDKKPKQPKIKDERAAINLSVPKEIKDWVCVHAKNTHHSLSQLLVKLIVQEQERVERENKIKEIMNQKEIELITAYEELKLRKMITQQLKT